MGNKNCSAPPAPGDNGARPPNSEGSPMARVALPSVVEHARIAASRSVPDADLLEQFLRTRDEAAFAALVRRHRPTVLAACRQVLADDAEVEDAAQQTFL